MSVSPLSPLVPYNYLSPTRSEYEITNQAYRPWNDQRHKVATGGKGHRADGNHTIWHMIFAILELK